MSDRLQLNLRLDGNDELLEAVRKAANSEKKSVNQWAIDSFKTTLGIPLQERLDNELEIMLEEKLANKFDARLDFALLEVREILTEHINSKLAFLEQRASSLTTLYEGLDLLTKREFQLVYQRLDNLKSDRDRPNLTQIAQEAGRSLRHSPELVTVTIEPEGISQRKLADRLNVDPETIARHKQKDDFEQWSSELDPDGLGWRYDTELKKYFGVN